MNLSDESPNLAITYQEYMRDVYYAPKRRSARPHMGSRANAEFAHLLTDGYSLVVVN